MTDSTEEAIRKNAEGPKRVTVDGTSVEQHSIQDQIEADRYLASKRAAKNPLGGIGRTKLVPPGATE